jgi:uncharacterized protein (TIGR03435 family)
MADDSDMELLREYCRQGSEEAFAALVQRHVNLVYSVALRYVGIATHAEEITQAVFVILARKAASLRPDTILEGWLHATTRLTALQFLRGERRRQFREQEAYMQSTLPESTDPAVWNRLAPLLDDALARLGQKDRDAVMLRFFKDKSVREVATALRVSEGAAQRRVLRAVEKLRLYFTKHGVVHSSAVLTATISAHSVQTAPAALAKAVATVVLAKGAAASSSTLTLIKGALKVMAWTKAKTAIVAGVVVLLAAGTATITVTKIAASRPEAWQKKWDLSFVDKLPPQVRIIPTTDLGWRLWGSRNGKMLGLGQSVPDLLSAAYGIHLDRLIFSGPVPKGTYDFISNLPQLQLEALRQEIEKKFGLIGRRELMETNVLILTVKTPNAPGLKRNAGGVYGTQTPDSYVAHDMSLWGLVDYLGTYLGTVVIDGTGLQGDFDVDFKWDSTPEGLKRVVLEQLGLELVPGRSESVEYLHIVSPGSVAPERAATPAPVPEGLAESDFTPRAGSDLQGYWKRVIGAGPDALPMDLKIAGQTDGTFRAEGDAPMQGFKGIPVSVIYNRPAVKLAVSGIGTFQGEINGDNTQISGAWNAGGQSLPTTLQRADYQAEQEQDAARDYTFRSKTDLQGHWKGTLDLKKVKLRLNLDIAKLPDGTFFTTVTSLDQPPNDAPIPASDFRYSAPDVRMAWKWVGISFDGKQKDGRLTGTWNQGGQGSPVVFERKY